jgi:hypothetical protein
MMGKWLNRAVRRHHRVMVAIAMVPLVVLNALPVSAGCICADGHREPVCHAGRCLARKGDCGCPCCARRAILGSTGCCKKTADRRPHPVDDQPPEEGRQGVLGNGCCTPIVHQSVPTVITLTQIVDSDQMRALLWSRIDVPHSVAPASNWYRIDFDTGPPPEDFVVTFRRLVI